MLSYFVVEEGRSSLRTVAVLVCIACFLLSITVSTESTRIRGGGHSKVEVEERSIPQGMFIRCINACDKCSPIGLAESGNSLAGTEATALNTSSYAFVPFGKNGAVNISATNEGSSLPGQYLLMGLEVYYSATIFLDNPAKTGIYIYEEPMQYSSDLTQIRPYLTHLAPSLPTNLAGYLDDVYEVPTSFAQGPSSWTAINQTNTTKEYDLTIKDSNNNVVFTNQYSLSVNVTYNFIILDGPTVYLDVSPDFHS